MCAAIARESRRRWNCGACRLHSDNYGADTIMSGRRVLIVVQNLPVPFDRRVWLEATTLTRAGYRVSVICPKAKGFNVGFAVLEGGTIYLYALPIDASAKLGFMADFAWCLALTWLLSLRVALFGGGFD